MVICSRLPEMIEIRKKGENRLTIKIKRGTLMTLIKQIKTDKKKEIKGNTDDTDQTDQHCSSDSFN
jgi:hypothetical protein